MKLLLTVQDSSIAPRFDLTTEVIIAEQAAGKIVGEPRTIILPRKSPEDISDLIVKEGIDCVICGGIEDSFHRFFTWKKILVIDGVIGSYAQALDLAADGRLEPGHILPTARSDQ